MEYNSILILLGLSHRRCRNETDVESFADKFAQPRLHDDFIKN